MATDDPPPPRVLTDESLRSERSETDRALETTIEAAGEDAKRVVERARDKADEIVSEARDKADTEAALTPDGAVQANRRIDDEALRQDRARADAVLMREVEESVDALRRLLPLERERTDRFLLIERERSDESVSQRDDFFGIVSHDVRNLLGGMLVCAGSLSRLAAHGDASAIAVQTERMQRYVARMNRLIGDLVDVASMEAGKLSIEPSSHEVRELLSESVDMFQESARAKNIALSYRVAAELSTATFDHDRLIQVFANLIANAIKFCPNDATIELAASSRVSEVLFSVTDTGPGMPPAVLERIFERFWRAEQQRHGLGLGLYIARCIVDAHGGRIWAESAQGRGSTFFVTLPA